jgi:methyltransferase (TIGR00027 family)
MTSTSSTRYEGDTWDLASSVGVTATMVAAARAMATRAENALINDPFAEPLVRAVGVELLSRLASGEVNPADLDDKDHPGRSAGAMARMTDNMAVRTKFFDEFFTGPSGATSAGIRQAVILASGLDSRAFRLPWPDGTVVYEIDQPQVIEFKSRTLAELGATPTADRRAVPIDLRDDWPTALRAAGFDPAQPTAWSAEGLLGYLPPEAQDRLLDTVSELSAPGSRFATESMSNVDPADREKMKQRMQSISERWRAHGFDIDMTGLVYFGDRNEAAPYLTGHGWLLDSTNARDLLAANGLPPAEDDDMPRAELCYVSGTLPAGRSDGDSWGPASSVGATATMVAVSRALASQGPDALLNDPLADPLVRAVGLDPFIRMIEGEITVEDDPLFRREAMNEQIAVRTRFFDDFFTGPGGAADAGIRQAVILASGLDTRAYRLRWPEGMVVYEIDQPQVIDFKTRTLAELGAAPTADRRPIGIDLRNDWPAALRQRGFDVDQPTAWIAEGLLVYLPPEAQDRLFDSIAALSASGSRVATEHFPDPAGFSDERAQRLSERWNRLGLGLNMSDLIYHGERSTVIEYLTVHGWDVTARAAKEMYAHNGFEFPEDEMAAAFGEMSYVAATLG